jgi:hypothetical protein
MVKLTLDDLAELNANDPTVHYALTLIRSGQFVSVESGLIALVKALGEEKRRYALRALRLAEKSPLAIAKL